MEHQLNLNWQKPRTLKINEYSILTCSENRCLKCEKVRRAGGNRGGEILYTT